MISVNLKQWPLPTDTVETKYIYVPRQPKLCTICNERSIENEFGVFVQCNIWTYNLGIYLYMYNCLSFEQYQITHTETWMFTKSNIHSSTVSTFYKMRNIGFMLVYL